MTRRLIVVLSAVVLTGALLPAGASPLRYEWRRAVGISLADVATDPSGLTVVTGEVAAVDHTAFLVAAFDANGNELWHDEWRPLRDRESGTLGTAVAIGPDGQVYALGFGWHCRFGCESGGWFIRAYTRGGDLRWTRQAAGWRTRPRQSEATGIDTWTDGLVIAGYEYDDYIGAYASWARAYRLDGTLSWKSRVAVRSHRDERVTAEDVAAGESGSAYVVGRVEPESRLGDVDHEPFVVRLGPDGERRWARVVTERGDRDSDSAFAVDVRGGALTVGSASMGNPIGYQVPPPHLGWLATYSLGGDLWWMRSSGSGHQQAIEDLVRMPSGRIFTVGGIRTADRSYALIVRTYTTGGDLRASQVLDPREGSLVGTGLSVGRDAASLVGTRYENAYLSPGIGGRLWRLVEVGGAREARMTMKVRGVTALAAVFVLSFSTPAGASHGWPQEGYDAGHRHANAREWRLRPDTVAGLRLLWSRSIRSADEGWVYEQVNLPVVRDAAYAWWLGEGVDPPRSVALSVDNGRVVWLRSQLWAVAAASDDSVYVNAGHRAMALDASTAERGWVRWGVRIDGATPSVGRLYVTTSTGVGTIDADTGADVWMRDGVAVDGEPLVSGGVYVTRDVRSGPDALVALDARTGAPLWEAPPASGDAYPRAAAGGLVYVVAHVPPHYDTSVIRAIRLEDGTTAWRRLIQDDLGWIAVGGGRLFVQRARCSTPDGCMDDWWRQRGALLALDVRSGRTLWSIRGVDGSPEPLWHPGALANGVLYVAGVRRWGPLVETSSRVAAISAASGRVRWTAAVDRAFVSISAVADGRVFAVTAGGPRGGRVLAYGLG